MPRLVIPTDSECRATQDIEVRNVQMVAEGSPFEMYKPDASKAFMEFDICHSIPDFLGPVGMAPGVANYCGFFPEILEVSHESLRFQQLNLRHLLKTYSADKKPGQGDKGQIMHDRIIGAIVATHFPRKPMTGWRAPGKPDGATACIKACAVVFKLANGVDRLLGQHLSGKDPQSVSIEVRTPMTNLGVYVPSRDQLVPLCEPDEDIYRAYKIVKGTLVPIIGKLPTEAHPGGEQLLVTYGINKQPVHFCGVGVTPTPAERSAEIVRIAAEAGDMVGIAAECVFGALVGQKVTFSTGRSGIVGEVHTSGTIKLLPAIARTATEADPVLSIGFPNGDRILRHYSELAERLA